MKQDILPFAQPFGNIFELQRYVELAIKNGATSYFCPIESNKPNQYNVRWIEFNRELSEKEVLIIELENAIKKVTEINNKIKQLDPK